MLEIFGQDVFGEFGDIPNNEGVAVLTPRDHAVGGRVIHHVVSLAQEWRHHAIHAPSRHIQPNPTQPNSDDDDTQTQIRRRE